MQRPVILVTGAHGQIGFELARLLAPLGEVGSKGFIFDVPTGNTSPLVEKNVAFLPVFFSYCSA